jgi:hypothetical protein
MRLELSGSIIRAEPRVKHLNTGFIPAVWLDLGYTNFDVICIGGGGGRGGGIDTANTGTKIRNYGGEGGGGGYQRVQGLLSALPSFCPVVVGDAGALGTEHVSNATLTTDGEDGGYSTFNDDLCQASGGKGGKRAQSNSATALTFAHGGDGGIGNRITAGGGAAGGVCGDPEDVISTATDGEDGTIIDDIGHGGGGGAGGIAEYHTPDGISYLEATAGGWGSYLPDDVMVAGNGEDAQQDPGTEVDAIKPGRGGGANASPLTGLPYNYGQAGAPGAVIIYLTSE